TTAASRRVESQVSCWSRPPWMRAAPARRVAAPARTARNRVVTPSRSARRTRTRRRLAAARKTTRSAASETIEVEVLTRPSAPSSSLRVPTRPRRRPPPPVQDLRKGYRRAAAHHATAGWVWGFRGFWAVSGVRGGGGAGEGHLAAPQSVEGGQGVGQRLHRDDLHLPGVG